MGDIISTAEARIEKLKTKIADIGNMRPGSLSQQFKKPKEKLGAFWQLNCTHKGKSYTEYVRPESLQTIERELKEYQRFKAIVDQWIEESINLSRARLRAKKAEGKGPQTDE